MCWLTTTGQTKPRDLTVDEIIRAATAVVLEHQTSKINRLHFNFMARGEFFNNNRVTTALEAEKLMAELLPMNRYWHWTVPTRVLISTILPKTFHRELSDVFPNSFPEIYYSLYTVNPETHKRWFPAAMNPLEGLAKLKRWQDHSGKIPKIHMALIAGVNDYWSDMADLKEALDASGLRYDFNLVRYNPPNAETCEASDITYRMAARLFGAQIVNRVGEDVYASCGMFFTEGGHE